MTLDRLRPLATRLLAPFVTAAVRLNLTPNAVSVIAFGFAGLAGVSFYVGDQWYLLGAVLVFLNGWLDLLDGALARELEVDSDAGDLLDHVLDRYADIVLIAGLAAGIDAYALGFAAVTGVVMTSYLGTQAQAVGVGRVYAGLLGRADRLAVIGIVAFSAPFLPPLGPLSVIGWLLVVLAVIGHLTAIQRFAGAWGQL
ncbi:MAG: CDP-alcohol phosphatidyltransferase family protein [Halobacteriales archaeon]|nr:CDP-alcohol phosphatidyltransferase family protein [Halobacteriales archaeon]